MYHQALELTVSQETLALFIRELHSKTKTWKLGTCVAADVSLFLGPIGRQSCELNACKLIQVYKIYIYLCIYLCNSPGGPDSKASAYNVEDLGSIPGSGRSSGEGNGNPLQYCCLENPMDGGAQ